VVVLHAELQVLGVTGEALPLVHEVDDLLVPVRMPLLVVLSGMLLTPALAKGPRRFVSGKARTLLSPELVWSGIDVVHLQLRLWPRGESPSPEWVLRVWAPPTYLWFLAYSSSTSWASCAFGVGPGWPAVPCSSPAARGSSTCAGTSSSTRSSAGRAGPVDRPRRDTSGLHRVGGLGNSSR
jgi:uncharacterized membrane protein YcfT